MGTLQPWADSYIRQGRKQGRFSKDTSLGIAYVLRALDKSYGDRRLEMFGRRAVERWLEDNEHWSAATRRSNYSIVHQFTNWLLQHRLLKTDPFTDLKAPKAPRPVPRPIDRDSIDKLMLSAPDNRARLIILLMFNMGMRCIGVASLRIEDIDYVSDVLLVKEKFGHSRRLPITPPVKAAIANYLAENPARTGPLVRSIRDGHLHEGISAAYVGKLVADWMRVAGVKTYGGDGRSAHSLRHTALTELAEATGDAFLVQELAGWSDLSTAAHYVRKASTERLREGLAKRDEVSS